MRETVRSAAPNAIEVISYGMPSFRQNGVLVCYAAFSDHLSLFAASTSVRRRFSAELAPFLGGKGTIRFTPDHPLPVGLVRRIVRMRVAENAKRHPRKRGDGRARAKNARPLGRVTSE